MFVVVSLTVDYKRPARYGDQLQVSCSIVKSSRASLTFAQEVRRATSAELLVSATVRIACLDAVEFRPRPLPDIVLQEIAGFGGER